MMTNWSLEPATLSARDLAQYAKLDASLNDIGTARSCASFILKKGWHTYSFQRRGSIPLQQIAFTTTMIVAYARPFSAGRGNFDFPKRLLKFEPAENLLHLRLLKLRNEEYAHTDASIHKVTPLKSDLIKNILSIRDVRFTPAELSLFLDMTSPLVERIVIRMEELRRSG